MKRGMPVLFSEDNSEGEIVRGLTGRQSIKSYRKVKLVF